MEKKRKISIRKVLQALVTIIVSTGCFIVVIGASKRQNDLTVSAFKLEIENIQRYPFLNKETLWKQLIDQQDIKVNKTKLSEINIGAIESKSYENLWVSQAKVYVDNKRVIHINVKQRIPAARIFFDNGQSFYLDTSLNLLPLSDMFTYYTTIVTNVPTLSNDSLDKKLKKDILKLVRFIDKDTFWSAQIAQVIVLDNMNFQLVPVLGKQKILFGTIDHLEDKFNNLFSFYKNVLNKIGWDKYRSIDLRFEKQIVTSPSLDWKPKSKNALSNMDWVKSIMEAKSNDSLVRLNKDTRILKQQ